MKKKKIAALALAAALVVGSGTYGAFSYFTDRAETKANIEIKVGNLKVESKNDNTWVYVPVGGMENDKVSLEDIEDNKVSNIRPGDAFEKLIVIKNTGSLTQDLEISKLLNIIPSPWKVTISGQTFNNRGVVTILDVEPNEEVNLTIRVELPTSTGNDNNLPWIFHEEYNRDTPNEFKLDLNRKFLSIEATQPNAR